MFSSRQVAGVVIAALCLVGMAKGTVPLKEDLADCKLPHGEAMLPMTGTAEATKGDLLKISEGDLTVIETLGDQGMKRAELAVKVREKNAGDLVFLPDEMGTFWAISGRIVDVGTRYLYEAAAMKLDRPAEISGNLRKPAGLMPEVHEGRTYLVETVDGHFALVRVLEINKTGVAVQYVYQPSGAVGFEMRKGELVDVTPGSPLKRSEERGTVGEVPATPGGGGLTPTVAGAVVRVGDVPKGPVELEPYMGTHLRQRTMLIATRMKTLKGPAKTQVEIDRKVDAINDLVALHADEAVDELVNQIAFVNPRGEGKEFKDGVHPCFAALKKMGKPASDAAVKALRKLDLSKDSEANGLESAEYRAGLLALVIRAVEGDDVGQFILQRERDATTDPKRRAMYEQLISPRK